MSYNPSQPIEKIDAAKFTVSDCEIKIETISTYKNNGYWFGNILETQKLWKTESFQGIKNKIRAIFYATIPSSLLCGYLLFINLAANSNRIGLFEKSILLTLGFLLSGGFWDLIKKLFQQPEQKITMIGKTTTKFISSGLFYITFGVLAYAPFQTTNTPNFWLRNFLFVVFLFTGGAAIYFIYKCITSLSAFLDACSTNNIDNW